MSQTVLGPSVLKQPFFRGRWLRSFVVILSLTFFSTSLVAPPSHALIGVLFKNRTVKTIGGVGALSAGAVSIGSFLIVKTTTDLGVAIGYAIIFAGTLALTGIGALILDDSSVADIEFRKLDLSDSRQYEGFTLADAQTYNQELPLLNAIRQTIQEQVSEDENTEDAEQLWIQYSSHLSPATFFIAQENARKFLEAITVKAPIN